MEHDVEAEGEGDDEEGIPDQEEEEGLQHFVQHRDVHVVPQQHLIMGFVFNILSLNVTTIYSVFDNYGKLRNVLIFGRFLILSLYT